MPSEGFLICKPENLGDGVLLKIKDRKPRTLLRLNLSLTKEWHPTKNGKLTPEDVTSGSHKKVWWQCKNGHEWEANISNRARVNNARGCPYCSNQKAYKDNCLATVNPKLAKEWHPTKNGNLTPYDVTPGSSRKRVWWQCKKGHEWESLVKSRSNGTGCPYCSSQMVCKDNCLATKNPKLAKEWHPSKNGALTPDDVTSSTGKKVWWVCKKGHEYKASVDNRSRDRGCPYCGNKKVCNDNCLATVKPALAKEWHPIKNGKLTPADVTPGTSKKVWWQCKKGHEWESVVASRLRGVGCPHCSPQTSVIELRIYAELKYIFPDTRLRERINKVECDIYIPSLKVGVEYDGEYWHRNKQEKDRSKNIDLENRGIKLIRVRELGLDKIAENDVVYDYTKKKEKQLVDSLLKEIESLSVLSSFDQTRVHWYLKEVGLANNKEFINLLDMLPSPIPGSSFADHNLKLAKEWHPSKNGALTPWDVTPRSNKKVWWQCVKGHEWESMVQNRFKGHGCPYCAGQRATRETSLAAKNPQLANKWHPTKNGELTPEDVMPGSNTKVWWQCKKGHEYISSVYNKSKGNGCPYCSRRRACEDNCLATVNPKLAQEWHPLKNGKLTPKDVTPKSHKQVWWQCIKGHEWEARVADRSNGNGCPFCSGRRK